MVNKVVYKGPTLTLDHDPRIGICSRCRAVARIDCIGTHMHHEIYDDNDPLANTIELCPKCHRRAHFEGYVRKDINVKVKKDVHQRLKRLLYRQPSEWTEDDVSDHGDVIEKLLDHWEKTKDKK